MDLKESVLIDINPILVFKLLQWILKHVVEVMLVAIVDVIISMRTLNFYSLVHCSMPQTDCVNAWLVSNQ